MKPSPPHPTVTSREIAELLAGSDGPARFRQKAARISGWDRSGSLRALGCGALNAGVGRGGTLTYPVEAKAWAVLLDEMFDRGATGAEIAMLFRAELRPWFDRAIVGEDLVLWWQKTGSRPIEAVIAPMPAALPEVWMGGRWLRLTRVFERAR